MSDHAQPAFPADTLRPPTRPDRATLLAWGGSAALAAALLTVSGGNPAVVAGLVLAAVVGWAIWRLPLYVPATGLLLATQLIDDPASSPGGGVWVSPIAPVAELLYDNLHKFTGISALRFSILDLMVVGLLLLALLRRILGTAAREGVAPAPAPFTAVVVGAFLALLVSLAWGLSRGGDFRSSLWQLRQLLALPLVTLLFLVSLRGPRDLKLLGTVLIGAGLAKTALAVWITETVFRPQNVRPPFVTTHADSMLFALAFIAVLAMWNEQRTRRTWTLLLVAGPLLLLAMKVNNRRLVFVEAAAALVMIFPLLPWTHLKRKVMRAVILSIPVGILYLAVGWNSTAKIFAPVKIVRSIAEPETDRSTAMRDIENYNLTVTFRTNPLLGVGFGHPYVEQVKADDISMIFPLYRYIPHNSVLAIWAFCGTAGFAAIWLPMLAGLFLAARTYRRSGEPIHRAAALTAGSMVVIHLIQAWGDMGIQAWSGVFLMAACLASVAQLAVAVGAYPAPRRRLAPGTSLAPGPGAA